MLGDCAGIQVCRVDCIDWLKETWMKGALVQVSLAEWVRSGGTCSPCALLPVFMVGAARNQVVKDCSWVPVVNLSL